MQADAEVAAVQEWRGPSRASSDVAFFPFAGAICCERNEVDVCWGEMAVDRSQGVQGSQGETT